MSDCMSGKMWLYKVVLACSVLVSISAMLNRDLGDSDTCTYSFVVPDTYGSCPGGAASGVLTQEVESLKAKVGNLERVQLILTRKLEALTSLDYEYYESEEQNEDSEEDRDEETVPMVTATPCNDDDIFVALGCTYDSSHESVVTFVTLPPTPFEVKKNAKGRGRGGFNFLPHFPPFPIFCSVDNWIVIQRRLNGFELSFNRSMDEYVNGFGDLKGEFWLGLEKIHQITKSQYALYELRAEALSSTNTAYFVQYSNFEVESVDAGYRMQYLARTATSSSTYGNLYKNVPFQASNTTCSKRENGGWFSGSACLANAYSNLNANAPYWGKSGATFLRVTKTVIKIRPILH